MARKTIQFDDSEEANKILFALQKNTPDILYAAILNADDHVFDSYTRPGFDSSLIPDIKNINEILYSSGSLSVSCTITEKKKSRKNYSRN